MGAFMIVKEAESSGPWTDLWITLHCLTDSIDWPAVQMSMLKSGEDGIYRPFAESKYLQYYKVQKDLDVRPPI